MPVDNETVSMLPGHRVGFLPPAPGSLAAGELYIELSPPDAPGTPKMWFGVPDYLGLDGNIWEYGRPVTPAKTEPAKTEPAKTEPAKTEPKRG